LVRAHLENYLTLRAVDPRDLWHAAAHREEIERRPASTTRARPLYADENFPSPSSKVERRPDMTRPSRARRQGNAGREASPIVKCSRLAKHAGRAVLTMLTSPFRSISPRFRQQLRGRHGGYRHAESSSARASLAPARMALELCNFTRVAQARSSFARVAGLIVWNASQSRGSTAMAYPSRRSHLVRMW
jgi:hypothetical protein